MGMDIVTGFGQACLITHMVTTTLKQQARMVQHPGQGLTKLVMKPGRCCQGQMLGSMIANHTWDAVGDIITRPVSDPFGSVGGQAGLPNGGVPPGGGIWISSAVSGWRSRCSSIW